LMIQGHMDRLNSGECKPENSNVFINLVGNLERCGDHFNFICERACDRISKVSSAHA
jgi:Na+/phosphate symporter